MGWGNTFHPFLFGIYNMDKALTELRMLDCDDLIIVSLMGEGYSQKEISRMLGTNPSTISQRTKKYDDIRGGILKKHKNKVSIAPKHRKFVNNIRRAAMFLLGSPLNSKCGIILQSVDDKSKKFTSEQLRIMKTDSKRGRKPKCIDALPVVQQ